VEPHELRVEALVKVRDFADTLELPDSVLDEDGKRTALSYALESLRTGVSVENPPLASANGELEARFIRFDAEKGFVADERTEIPLDESLIGMTLAFSVSGVSELEMEWGFFGPEQGQVAIEISSNSPPSGRYVTKDAKRVSWKSSGESGATPELTVPTVEMMTVMPASWLRIPAFIAIVIGIVVLIKLGQKTSAWMPWLFAIGAGALLIATKVRSERVVPPVGEDLENVVYGLLRNVYRSFEFRDESTIYDELEKSVKGDLLETIYLEIRGSLELENTGGPRVRVSEVALRDIIDVDTGLKGSHWATAEWVTIGQVTHWGHTHERTNKYQARFGLFPVETHWKIGELKLLSEEREQKISRQKTDSTQ